MAATAIAESRPLALVIGGLGYVGQAVTERLLAGGFRIRCVDSLLHGQKPPETLISHPDFELVTADIRDGRKMELLVRDPDAILLLAGLVGEAACEREPGETLQTNLLAPLSIWEAALYHGRAERFLFVSSDSCYGKRPGEVLYETSRLAPCSLYASLKARTEQRILASSPRGTFPKPVILRLATVYGYSPRMRFDLAANLLVREATLKRRLIVHSGEQWRPFVHVRDAAEAFYLALAAPLQAVAGEVFNVGSNDLNVQFKDLGALIASQCEGAELTFSPGEPDLRDYRVDFSKIREILDFQPRTSLADGLAGIRDAILAGVFPDPYSPLYRNA
ncbi:MAG: NAD(P)-dependent oxidoreductase [Deltaproteobacteria bacterium]|jgi:nucleoside-diphosphate-sugar epimerase|nr:NAD(P)-dependent oxidoreductase [Deltaproteobacteria bacterium]